MNPESGSATPLDPRTKVLVTGSAGFLGSNTLLALAARGVDHRGIDIRKPPNGFPLPDRQQLCDVRDRHRLAEVVKSYEPDVILHLAARTDLDGSSVRDYDSNVVGVANLLSILSETRPQTRLVLASSRLVFGIHHRPANDWDYAPTTHYGESKAVTEQLTRAAALPNCVTVRPTSLWGPWFGTPYRLFFDMVRKGFYVAPSDRSPYKSFGYVGNAVHQLLVLAGSHAVPDGPLWLSDYEPYDLNEWAEEIRLALGARRIPRAPSRVLRAVGYAGSAAQKLGAPSPVTAFRMDNLLADMVYDTTATQQVVGSLPFTRVAGVEETVGWLASRPAAA